MADRLQPFSRDEEKEDSVRTEIESHCGLRLIKFENTWIPPRFLAGVEAMYQQFEARPDDIILASGLKTGTTWIKALLYTTLSSGNNIFDALKERNPHELVPTMEIQAFGPFANHPVSDTPSPRLLHTHLPFHALPHSIKASNCKIIYIARNPKDVFVSLWQFHLNLQGDGLKSIPKPVTKEGAFHDFCSGFFHFGPFFDHVLGYWERRYDGNVLFLTYEDLQADGAGYVGKMADFLGRSSLAEEDIRRIVKECSFESLSSKKVNKTGVMSQTKLDVQNKNFFRKGQVGDWKKYFTAEMDRKMNQLAEDKMRDCGLHFTYELNQERPL